VGVGSVRTEVFVGVLCDHIRCGTPDLPPALPSHRRCREARSIRRGGGGSKLEFTLIGDAVNIAARVEQLTKTTGDAILLTHQTVDALVSGLPGLTDRHLCVRFQRFRRSSGIVSNNIVLYDIVRNITND
jgi:hypothetical protein